MKKFIAGLIVGIILATAVTSYAATRISLVVVGTQLQGRLLTGSLLFIWRE